MPIINTVGALRDVIKDLPDSMELLADMGCNIEDFLTDSDASVKPATLEFGVSVESRCDDVERLYVSVDAELYTVNDPEPDEEDES
jgi:phosphate uptake regulator